MSMFSALADTSTAAGNGDFSVTITNNDSNTGHSYKAYQVFSGDLVEKTGATTGNTGANLTLSNIVWGSGVNGDDIVTALVGITDTNNPLKGDFTAGMTAEQVAKKLENKADDSAYVQAFAEVVHDHLKTNGATGTGSATGVTGLTAGYYFIQDEGNMATDADNAGALSRYILQVVHSVSITQKANVPTVDKTTKDKDDTTGTESEWQNTSEYDVGDAVPFKIVGTLPSNFAEYDYFKTYTFTDTLSAGFDAPDEDDITIKVGSTDVKSHFDIDINGQVITIRLQNGEDLKTWTNPSLTASSTFVVEYSAVLNNSAVSGPTGNENEVTLTFSNNPNADGEGGYDTTPPDTVIVFTFDLKISKKDGSNSQALNGAAFALYKKYKTEADVPAGATKVTTGKVSYDNNRKEYTFTVAGEEVWALVEQKTTAAGSQFDFLKIDEGDYVLVETTTPDGYNSVAPYAFTVSCTVNDAGKTLTKINGVANGETVNLGDLTATVVMDVDEGSLNADVINNSGNTLPSTGGMGTTLLYVGGSILVVLAAILLITKRRMSSEE